jgi:hypothetical protein
MDKARLRFAERNLEQRFQADRAWEKIIPLVDHRWTGPECSGAHIAKTGRLLEQAAGESDTAFQERYFAAARADRSLLVEVRP